MKQLGKKAWSKGPLLALVIVLFLQAGCSKSSEPVTIRLAGDEWFLKSLTKTGLIAGYEEKTGVRVEVLDRNDRRIMNDLSGGDAAAHSSVQAFQGSSPATAPKNKLIATFAQNSRIPNTRMAAPMVEIRFSAPNQGISG